jgi:predicted membrane GTPase involved in stress response
VAGNIIGLSGFEEIDIGETLAGNQDVELLPFVEIDPPTVMMSFSVNDGPHGWKGRRSSYFPGGSRSLVKRSTHKYFD